MIQSIGFRVNEARSEQASFSEQRRLLRAGLAHASEGPIQVAEEGAGPCLASASFQVSGGFVGGYPPPGRVLGMSLSGTTLQWTPEPSAGECEVYRGLMSPPGTFGTCLAGNITGPTIPDTSDPPAGNPSPCQ